MTLAEALSQVELEPGRTYECHVQGKRVVVQVAPGSITQPAARYDESDVMLDPWCDLPSPGKGVEVPVFPGKVTTPAARFDESDVMLDPWCDLPPQGTPIPARVRVGELPLDIPHIPRDDE